MYRKLVISVLSLCFAFSAFAQQLDSTRLAPLDSLLGEYYEAMIYEATPAKYQECDFLIESCKDSLVRQWVATRILVATHWRTRVSLHDSIRKSHS